MFFLVNWILQKVLSETAAVRKTWGTWLPKALPKATAAPGLQLCFPTSPRAATEQC